jgi:lipopolysaccharide transport system permease protein
VAADPQAGATSSRRPLAVPFAPPHPSSSIAVGASLFWTLVRTDFKSRYQGSWGGFVWALLKPMSLFIVLMSVFSFVFASDPTYKLDLIVGLFLWDFFAEGTKTGLVSLHAKGYLLSKARCPSWILVLSSLANAALTLGVFSLVIVAFLGFSGRLPALASLGLFALYCLALAAMVAGFSLATSVLFLRYRDLNQVWDVVSQAGFFLAPIIYPLGILPESIHRYLYLWPPTAIIEFSRAVLVSGAVPTAKAHLLLALDAGVILIAGILVFRRLSPRAAEYL